MNNYQGLAEMTGLFVNGNFDLDVYVDNSGEESDFSQDEDEFSEFEMLLEAPQVMAAYLFDHLAYGQTPYHY